MRSALLNVLMTSIIGLGCLCYIAVSWMRSRKQSPLEHASDHTTISMDVIIHYIKNALHELSHRQLADAGLGEEEYKRRLQQRTELRKALKGCVSGSVDDKKFVKQMIADLLIQGYGLQESQADSLIPFENPDLLTSQDKFEIIFYLFQQQFGADALARMLDTYGLAQLRPGMEGDGPGSESYWVDHDDIDHIFRCEYQMLHFHDKLQIIAQRVYQQYKGFSVADDIRDQRIDGVSGGVSGITESSWIQEQEPVMRWSLEGGLPEQIPVQPANGCESVWVFYKGKSIHFSFLSFGSESELKRVCQNIYKYNHPGQLSEANGYKVNEMKDGSRVVVVRPPFSESWAFFVRKFDTAKATLEQLITGPNAELPIQLLSFLMKGSRITAITGAQGSGKTTMLMAMVGHIYAMYTLRVQEMAFELHLRRMYSRRNILSFKETDHISGQDGLDLQKKTDGTVNILGEVASDGVAAWMIQMSQVASLFTVFTHHAKTFRDLVFSLRNSLLKAGVFQQEDVAEEQVVSVINFDVHLKKDADGRRYIERITECIPIDAGLENSDTEPLEDMDYIKQWSVVSREYMGKRLNRTRFITRNIVEYENGHYITRHAISQMNAKEMKEQMNAQDRDEFEHFLAVHWGTVVHA
ncbi:ATPase, T2SS/T4P/T4SS family [Paenibacillus sp. JX-17]|uniref:ATPase, T2SS/T4P/T4SS family n=1 Tax=Paenibacillus lacisoli TaxID=3064525 RepID=A0ABT9C6M7_9BACL|nr:ATPase, T2SS/T4P/T4SS family [Paenibacillus sp. JX-17]MDO7904922.1 ATPase, T2SS/T4P/T4SS family [Paenibacillus sp. JX-17]